MSSLTTAGHFVAALLPLFFTLVAVVALLWCAHLLLIKRYSNLGNERLFPRQLIMLALTIAGLVAAVFALPVSEGLRVQIVGLIGLIISGIFAFSSTNIFANLAAGVLLRVTRPFQVGDFIYVGEYFGRVAERGLFDTEIQSETGELIAIPNTFVTSRPVSTVRRSTAVVSTSLSLGYDLHHATIEPLLMQAAEQSGLNEPFVHITELGNYAITYRVAGVLPEVKGFITARSRLHRALLDVLHGNGVEIVSPDFTNRRDLGEQQRFVPTPAGKAPAAEASGAEEILFDKAEQAATIEAQKQELRETIQQMEESLKAAAGEEKTSIKHSLETARERLKALDEASEDLKSRDEVKAKNPSA